MPASGQRQFVVIRVLNVVDEADFFSRLYNAGVKPLGSAARQVDTGAFVIRIEQAESEKDRTRGVSFEISVDNVNKFTEEVWNRGVKYISRPQNHRDGFRRVAFMSPGENRVSGVGPLTMESTGAFAPYRPDEK